MDVLTPQDTAADAVEPAMIDYAERVRGIQEDAAIRKLHPDDVTLPLPPGAPSWVQWVQFAAASDGQLLIELTGSTHASDGVRAWLKQIITVVTYPENNTRSRPLGWARREPVSTEWDSAQSRAADAATPANALAAADEATSRRAIAAVDPSHGDEELLTAFAEYLRAGNRAARTIESRESLLRTFAKRQDVALIAATVFHLRRDIGREGIAPATRDTTRSTFRAFYGFLYSEGMRADNPALRLLAVKVPPHQPRPYTDEQIDRLLSAGAYKKTRAMILLGCKQGLRASEIAAVHSDDIDLAGGTFKVLGKGGRTDYLPLHDTVRELAGTMPQGWWFPARGDREGHIKGRSVSDLLTAARNRAGITDKRLTGHSLRHSHATELVRRGANIRAVQELMRHSNLGTTQRYVEVLDGDRRAALSLLPKREIPEHSGRKVASMPENKTRSAAERETKETV